ncbi:MAG: dihydroneopterin aldolase [Ignavibacteria bacterium RIFOXYB2_FULL_35_12]|nr:MAG: dihydroneopterin aldolase [Ignavibacteria bacterium GWA2_36_19]OGU56211.1 MAG: dihydroneopterin aldolase [Ignavibacteria bacterium GWF2_35_20]OGU80354.1 MAG: dihydroneopterin aldolase [Ignavibacteria bacterium RIFOXYA2_FULL_35_9]OGU86723.1 MAG: dihydroneopterin aldolase [Ignavibacteria bacterium RIFOXYC12_FULL_35_11]OGU89418.1 MAG: dihydroneopterin aldolase [Ignavibacteria bacterium RIFOXYA12_FULL_35_25]OGU94110.1 MAG: dihydroneopterin aldolase [Ignavibacteria bacterium RIFOXYB12_FULL_
MNNIIRIKKATFYGYHGVLSEEQSVGGKFEADVDIYTDFSEAAKKDSLRQTIDYNAVYKFLYKMALEQKYYLIESLASKIADELLKTFEKIHKVNVRVRKNNPPLGGVVDCVEVEVEKSRFELL